MARKIHVPTVDDLKKLGFSTPVCNEIRKIVGECIRNRDYGNDMLNAIREYIETLDPTHDLVTRDVESLSVSLYHSGNTYFHSDVGYYINLGDTYDTTLVYVDESGILGNHAEDDPKNPGQRIWVDGSEGLYVSEYGEVVERWEEKTRNNLTEQDIEDMGPDSDSGCDLWTDDARHFFVFYNGIAHYEKNGHDKLAFHIDAPTPPDAIADRVQRLFEEIDRWMQVSLDAKTVEEEEHADAMIEACKKKQTELRAKVDAFEDPWDGSSDARDECDRMGVWYFIHKYQSTQCSGNVWFRERRGSRNWEWKLIRYPKNYAYFSRSQEWRKAFRNRQYTRTQEEAAAKVAQKAEIGATPQKGDLYSYNLLQPGMFGVEVYVFDGVSGNAGLGPILTVRKGDLWSAIHHALRQQRVHLGRKVNLWSAPDWLSKPSTWALVTPPPER